MKLLTKSHMRTEHLPFPMPKRKFSLKQNWVDLTFMHWEVDPKILAKHIPEDLEIELFEGKAYLISRDLLVFCSNNIWFS